MIPVPVIHVPVIPVPMIHVPMIHVPMIHVPMIHVPMIPVPPIIPVLAPSLEISSHTSYSRRVLVSFLVASTAYDPAVS
jgi:hypothetical protein